MFINPSTAVSMLRVTGKKLVVHYRKFEASPMVTQRADDLHVGSHPSAGTHPFETVNTECRGTQHGH